MWPRVTRLSRFPQASEQYFRETSNYLFPLNNHYENKQGPYNQAYICFFINPPIPLMSLFCTIMSIFPLWNRISRWHSMRHMFGFSLIQQFPCRVDPYQVNKIKNYIIFESQIYLIVHPVLSCSQSHLSKMQICHFDV